MKTVKRKAKQILFNKTRKTIFYCLFLFSFPRGLNVYGIVLQLFFSLSNATRPRRFLLLSVTVGIMRARNNNKRFSAVFPPLRGESVFKDSLAEFSRFPMTLIT